MSYLYLARIHFLDGGFMDTYYEYETLKESLEKRPSERFIECNDKFIPISAIKYIEKIERYDYD